MAKSKRTKKTVAIGTWPTPDAKRGKVSCLRGKYFLTIGRRKLEIPVGTIVTEQDARSMVGKDVYAAVTRSNVTALFVDPRWITCYVPAEAFLRKVLPSVQRTVARKMVREKIISPEFEKEIISGIR